MDAATIVVIVLASIIGLFLLIKVVKLLAFLKLTFVTSTNLKKRYAKAGNWAVVTGASDGIGLAMVKDLARRGFNVCLISRTKSKLDAAAAAITKNLNVETKVIAFDFQHADAQAYKNLEEQIATLQIAVLVNNVGINYKGPQFLSATPLEEDLNLLKVNCESTIRMTKMVLPAMQRKKAGAIVCLGSFLGRHPAPFWATYAGTKAFNSQFSECLAAEVKRDGIDVLAVTPGLVRSKMTDGVFEDTSTMVDADEMARASLNKLGATTRTDGHPRHAFIEGILDMFPTSFVNSQIANAQFASKEKSDKVLTESL